MIRKGTWLLIYTNEFSGFCISNSTSYDKVIGIFEVLEDFDIKEERDFFIKDLKLKQGLNGEKFISYLVRRKLLKEIKHKNLHLKGKEIGV